MKGRTGVYKRTPEMQTGKYVRTAEHCAINSACHVGLRRSPETIERMRLSRTGKPCSSVRRTAMKRSFKVAANLIRARQASRLIRPTGIECILRELLLPTLLPGRRILHEHKIKCPADFRIQSTYQVDAYVPKLRLVVEADGDYWHSLPDPKVRDFYKDKFLRADGFTVVHFRERELNVWAEGNDPGPEFWAKVDEIGALQERIRA
jgi:hypothetical protein